MTNNEVAEFGFGGIWGIIMLLIVAGLFTNGGFGFGNNNASLGMSDEFIKRDIFNTNTAVLTSANDTQRAVDNVRYDLGLGLANINQNLLLGNSNIASSMSSCCCDIKNAIHSEGEQTRALITQNRIADLEKDLVNANTIISNATQTQNILSQLGTYYPKTGVSPYLVYGGTTIQ